MAPSVRVKAAFQAMENIGIPKHKTKPALKKLLQLFDKNWDLIEEENYRVLADAIFEYEDTEAAEKEKKTPANTNQGDILEDAAPSQEEPERPLKRLRLKHQDQAVPSHGKPNSTSSAFVLKIPKPEPGEPEVSFNQWVQPAGGSPQPIEANRTTESQLISPQHAARNKGKQPISPTPQVASRDKIATTQRASQALQIKEPKPEPDLVLSGKQKQSDTNSLLKPKDEPFTEDMVPIEPLAIIPPEPSSQEPSYQHSNPVDSQEADGRGTSKSVKGIDKGAETVPSLTLKENHLNELGVPGIAPTNIDIAASPLGEVKICLSCNHGVKGNDFHVSDLQVVLKEVEDNCIKTYKVMNPEFSVTNLMREICECVVEFGTTSDDVTQEKLNPKDAALVGRKGTCCLASNLNGSINADSCAPADNNLTEASDPPSASNCQEMGREDNCSEGDLSIVAGRNSKSLITVKQQLNHEHMRFHYDASDITRGKEKVKVSLEKSNAEFLPSFHYICKNVISHNANVVFSLAEIGDKDYCFSCHGDCSSLSSSCNCVQRNGGESPYAPNGLVREEFLEECISLSRNPQKHCLRYCKECPLESSKNEDTLDPCKGHLKRKFIKECWTKCGCSRYCGNRVVQQGIKYNLQVFWTREGKGWGLRTLEEIPKGAFVCEYVGEILTNAELHKRSLRRSNDKHSYSVLLDADWGSRGLKENELLCLDATFYGNVARFINHRCSDANLIEVPVEVETPKHYYYHIALFTTRKIDAFEELTWDYGIDFDDNEQHIKAFCCLCGSKFCRNMKRSSRSRSTLTLS